MSEQHSQTGRDSVRLSMRATSLLATLRDEDGQFVLTSLRRSRLAAEAVVALIRKEVDMPASERDELMEEIAILRDILTFADGHSVAQTGYSIAALYASDAPHQAVLQRAGCHSREHRPQHYTSVAQMLADPDAADDDD